MKLNTLIVTAGVLLGSVAQAQSAGSAASTGTPQGGMQQGAAQPGQQDAATGDANLRKVTIKVKSVDKKNHRVTFEAQVAPEAKVEQNGQPMKIDSLKPGDEVRAAFDPTTGEVMTLEVKKGSGHDSSMH